MNFDEFWGLLQANLDKGTIIRNWTAAKGFTGEPFVIAAVSSEVVAVRIPGSEKDPIARKEDFRLIFDRWPEYVSGSFPRSGFLRDTWVSKYTISIIHQLIGDNV